MRKWLVKCDVLSLLTRAGIVAPAVSALISACPESAVTSRWSTSTRRWCNRLPPEVAGFESRVDYWLFSFDGYYSQVSSVITLHTCLSYHLLPTNIIYYCKPFHCNTCTYSLNKGIERHILKTIDVINVLASLSSPPSDAEWLCVWKPGNRIWC